MSQIQTLPEPLIEIRPRNLRWWMQISVFLLVLVELCWILPWFNMVTQISSGSPLWIAGLVLGGVMITAFGAAALAETLRVIRGMQLVILGALLVISIWIGEKLLIIREAGKISAGLTNLDPGTILVLFFIIWMWWRGISLAQGGIRPIIVWRRFEFGLLFFMGYILIAGRTRYVIPGFGVFVLFLIIGLMAVVVARIAYVGVAKGVQKNPFDLRWLMSVSGIIGLVVLFSAFVGGLLSGQYRPFLDFIVEFFKWVIAVVIFIIGIPGLVISTFLIPLMPWLRSLFSPNQPASPIEYPSPALPSTFPIQEEIPRLPLNLQAFLFWGFILLLIFLLLLRIRKSQSGKPEAEIEGPESLLDAGEARKVLRKNFQEAIDGIYGRLKLNRSGETGVRIRRIYQQLLQLNHDLDHPRLPQQTPLEFLPEMGKIFNNRMDDLLLITNAYIQVRYGERSEELLNYDGIEIAWKNIQEDGKRLKKSGLGKLITAEMEQVERGPV